ncbi:hypothetical protein [Streptomyces sp. NPDC001404]|uniref:hypothetical protein n=1 Tax=Streptomyces sp. NPDC001404 TaxID=3364571 RepID=UPI0036791D84
MSLTVSAIRIHPLAALIGADLREPGAMVSIIRIKSRKGCRFGGAPVADVQSRAARSNTSRGRMNTVSLNGGKSKKIKEWNLMTFKGDAALSRDEASSPKPSSRKRPWLQASAAAVVAAAIAAGGASPAMAVSEPKAGLTAVAEKPGLGSAAQGSSTEVVGERGYGLDKVPEEVKAGGVTQFAGGSLALFALKEGNVYAWGSDAYGQISKMPEEIKRGGVDQIASGVTGTYAVKDGKMYAWGQNDWGSIDVPDELKDANNVKSISADMYNGLALLDDGKVIPFGSQWWGMRDMPEEIKAGGVDDIAAAYDTQYALKGGKVYSWGWEAGGSKTKVPDEIKAGGVEKIFPAYHSVFAVKNGNLYGWGNDEGNIVSKIPEELKSGGGVTFATGNAFTAYAVKNGKLYAWGTDYMGSLDNAPVKQNVGTSVMAKFQYGAVFAVNNIADPAITSPAGGATVGTSFTATGTAEPQAKVKLQLGGTSVTVVADGNGAWRHDFKNVAEGAQALKATQSNRGLTSNVATRNFTVDAKKDTAAAPVVTSPGANTTVNSPVKFEGTADYAKGVRKVKLTDKDTGKTLATYGVNTAGKWWSGKNALVKMDAGKHTVTATSIDATGKAGATSTTSFTVK